ncbi:hypothetical protein ABZ819_05590 [Streptomyces venezuelae]
MKPETVTKEQGRLLDHLDRCPACRRLEYCSVGRRIKVRLREARK